MINLFLFIAILQHSIRTECLNADSLGKLGMTPLETPTTLVDPTIGGDFFKINKICCDEEAVKKHIGKYISKMSHKRKEHNDEEIEGAEGTIEKFKELKEKVDKKDNINEGDNPEGDKPEGDNPEGGKGPQKKENREKFREKLEKKDFGERMEENPDEFLEKLEEKEESCRKTRIQIGSAFLMALFSDKASDIVVESNLFVEKEYDGEVTEEVPDKPKLDLTGKISENDREQLFTDCKEKIIMYCSQEANHRAIETLNEEETESKIKGCSDELSSCLEDGEECSDTAKDEAMFLFDPFNTGLGRRKGGPRKPKEFEEEIEKAEEVLEETSSLLALRKLGLTGDEEEDNSIVYEVSPNGIELFELGDSSGLDFSDAPLLRLLLSVFIVLF